MKNYYQKDDSTFEKIINGLKNAFTFDTILEEITKIFNESNVETSGYLVYPAEDIEINNKILEVLCKHIKTHEDVKTIAKQARNEYISIVKNVKTNPLTKERMDRLNICYIVKKYLQCFYNSFFRIQDGKIIRTNYEKFELPYLQPKNAEEIIKNNKYLENKAHYPILDDNCEINLIILPNGTCYFAPIDHQSLAYWLNINGIDINNAIRFEVSKDVNDFRFSTLYNCEYSIDSNDNEMLIITDKQAEVLGGLYQTVRAKWRNIYPYERSLHMLNGFGFSNYDYDKDFAKTNLEKLGKYSNGLFDDYDYFKKTNAKHQPLPND